MERYHSEQLLDFIDASPSCFHVIDNLKKILETEGFTELQETHRWELEKGG